MWYNIRRATNNIVAKVDTRFRRGCFFVDHLPILFPLLGCYNDWHWAGWDQSADVGDFLKKFQGCSISVWWCGVHAIQYRARCRCPCCIAKLLEEVTVANWSFPCQHISFLVYLREDCFFDCFLCHALHDNPVRALNLYWCCAAGFFLSSHIIELPSKKLLLFPLDNSTYFLKRLLVFLLQRNAFLVF